MIHQNSLSSLEKELKYHLEYCISSKDNFLSFHIQSMFTPAFQDIFFKGHWQSKFLLLYSTILIHHSVKMLTFLRGTVSFPSKLELKCEKLYSSAAILNQILKKLYLGSMKSLMGSLQNNSVIYIARRLLNVKTWRSCSFYWIWILVARKED